jgi:hypothetical protein
MGIHKNMQAPTVTTKLTRKKPVRRVFGRLTRLAVPGQQKLVTVELTKAGVLVHKRAARRKGDVLVGFERLCNGGGIEVDVAGEWVTFTMTDKGVEARRGGSKQVRLMDWAVLENMSRVQPLLFAKMPVDKKEEAK